MATPTLATRAFEHRPSLDLARSIGWLFAALGFAVAARPIGDNSFLTHVATGRLILDGGGVPVADPYSWSATGEPWTVQSWLVSLVYAAVDATLGLGAVRVVHGVIGAAVLLGVWRLLTPARELLTRVVLVALVVLIGTYLWPPRPLLVGLLGMVVALEVVAGRRSRWVLVPVFWVWVNSHGSFVLGIGLLGAVAVGALIDERRLPRPELAHVAAGVAGVLVGLVNPLTWRLLWFPFALVGDNRSLDRVSEWAAPSFRSPIEYLFIVLIVLVVVGAARGAPWRALVPAIAFAVAGLLAVRNIGLAAVVITTVLAPALAGLGGTVDGSERRGSTVVAGVAFAAFALLVVGTAWSEPLDLEDYPVEEVRWLEERELVATAEVRLANRDIVGNYLTFRFGADARVFMDDRFDFYPQDVIDDHNDLLLGGDIAEIVDRRGFDVVVWESDTLLERWLVDADDWVIATAGDEWFVACRTSSPIATRCR